MANQTITIPGVGPVEFPDSMADADIIKAIPNIQKQHFDEQRTASRQTFEASLPKYDLLTRAADKLQSFLPSISEVPAATGAALGTAAGIPLGPPGMAAGAAFGAAGGEAAKQLYQQLTGSPSAPQTAAQAAQGPAQQAAMWGGMTGVPGLAQASVQPSLEAGDAITNALRSRLNAATTPERQLARATANREAVAASPSILDSFDVTKPLSALKTVDRMTMTPRAAIQEKMARFLANGMPIGPEVAQDEASRLAQAAALNPPEYNPDFWKEPQQSSGTTITEPSAINRQMIQALRAETPKASVQHQMENAWAARGGEIQPKTFPDTGLAEPYKPAPNTGLPSMTPPQTSEDLNRWMNVTTNQMTHGANPGKQLIDENLLGADKKATLGNTQAALADAGQVLEGHLQAATQKGLTLDAQTPLYDALNIASSKLNAPTDEAFTKHLNTILDKIEGRYPDLGKLPPDQTQKLKIEVGDAIHWSGTGYDEPINKALIQFYGDLNQLIKDNVPGAVQSQARWANLYQAAKALKLSLLKDAIGRGTGAAFVTGGR